MSNLLEDIIVDELTVMTYGSKVEVKDKSIEDGCVEVLITFSDPTYKTQFFNKLVTMKKAKKLEGDLGKIGCYIYEFDGDYDNIEPAGNSIIVYVDLPGYIELFSKAYA